VVARWKSHSLVWFSDFDEVKSVWDRMFFYSWWFQEWISSRVKYVAVSLWTKRNRLMALSLNMKRDFGNGYAWAFSSAPQKAHVVFFSISPTFHSWALNCFVYSKLMRLAVEIVVENKRFYSNHFFFNTPHRVGLKSLNMW